MIGVRTCRLPTVEPLLADEALTQLKPRLSRLHAKTGPSISPDKRSAFGRCVKAQQITKGGASGGLSRRRRTAQLSITSVLFRIESGQGVFLRLLQLAIFPNYFQVDRFIVDDSINDPLHVIRIRTWQVCDIKH